MSSTGLKTIDSDDIYCTSLTVSGINIITSLNNLNITSSNNLNALSTYSNLNIENLKLTSTTIFNNLNALSTYSNLNIENLKLTSTTIFNNLNSFSTNAQLQINNLSSTSLINKTDFNNLFVSGVSTFLNNLNISGNTNINNVLTVRGNSSWGYITLNSGFLGNQVGHIDFHNVTGLRRSYIGWEDTLNYLTMSCENGLLGYRIKAGSLIIDNNLNVTGTSLINGISTFLSTLNISGATTINNSLNVVGNITTSGLSIFNINSTVGTIFNNLNSFSTNAQLSINNLNATSTTIFNNLNSFSTNAQLSINNLNATSTTLFNRTNISALVVANDSTFVSSLTISNYTYHYNTAYFFNAAIQARNTFSLPTASSNGTGKILFDQGATIGAVYPCDIGVASNAAVPTRVFWHSAPTGATHRFFINGSTCLDIGCNTDNVYRCTIEYPTQINSSLNCSGALTASSGIHNFTSYLYINSPVGTTHFPWSGNNENYIRGKLNVDSGNSYFSGYMGIGTNSPSTRIHIAGNWPFNQYNNNPYITSGGFAVGGATFTDFCAIFDSSIWIKSWVSVSSDERIKENIEDINDETALQKILMIEPKTYNYKDRKAKGDNKVYGFIAQQVKEIIPEAVKLGKDYLPNIYKLLNVSENIITTDEDLTSILSVNDKVKIIDNDKSDEYKIIEISNEYIKVDKNIKNNQCFIYGKEVNDFHTLSKEYIFTLNVCATQELYKLIQQQQIIINDLQNRLSILENKNI